jgi:hypothetical protein
MDRLPPYAVAGRGIRFSGRLTVDTTGVGGEEVRVKYCLYDRPTVCYDIGSAITASDGSWYIDWGVPYGMACRRYLFRAYHPASGTESATQEMAVAYPTRISDFTAPSKVGAGVPFTVSGKLEYESSAGTWNPLGGRTVSIYYDNTKLVDVTTASDGSFTATVSIPTPGTYTLKAYYAGEGLTATAAAIAAVGVEVPEYVIPLAGIGAVVALVAIPILVNVLKR